MSTPQLTKVVHIGTGEVIEAAIESFRGGGGRVWRPQHLKKDGGFPLNKYGDGSIVTPGRVYLTNWAVYDEQRELKAGAIRDHIEELRERVAQAEEELLALYK